MLRNADVETSNTEIFQANLHDQVKILSKNYSQTERMIKKLKSYQICETDNFHTSERGKPYRIDLTVREEYKLITI